MLQLKCEREARLDSALSDRGKMKSRAGRESKENVREGGYVAQR